MRLHLPTILQLRECAPSARGSCAQRQTAGACRGYELQRDAPPRGDAARRAKPALSPRDRLLHGHTQHAPLTTSSTHAALGCTQMVHNLCGYCQTNNVRPRRSVGGRWARAQTASARWHAKSRSRRARVTSTPEVCGERVVQPTAAAGTGGAAPFHRWGW